MTRPEIATFVLCVVMACGTEDSRDAPEYGGDSSECAEASCEVVCDGAPIACVDVCGGEEHYEATCEAGAWSCGLGTDADACLTCAGEPVSCIEACGSDVQLDDAICEGALWRCTDGVLETSCAPCEGEEPLECAASCDEGEIYEASCIDEAWDCGDGVVLESCGSACGDEGDPCPEGCGGDGSEPWACVPSCEVFEVYDAACVEGEWSCGEGMLAADC